MSKKILRKRKKRNPLRKIKRKPIPLKKTKKSKKIKRKKTKSKLVPTNPRKNLFNKSNNSSPTEWRPNDIHTMSSNETSSKPNKKISHSTTWKACSSMSPFTWLKLMPKHWFSTVLKATLLLSHRQLPVKYCWQSCAKSSMNSLWLMKNKRRTCC